VLVELGQARAVRFDFFLNSTFHIHICEWVIGVIHAWKGGKLVNN
jgi:hypothetical protein